jgi:hypothetical protein
MLRRLATFCAFCLCLCSCSTTNWEKPGAADGDMQADRFNCLQQSQVHSAAGWGGSTGLVTDPKLFDACMAAKGWRAAR